MTLTTRIHRGLSRVHFNITDLKAIETRFDLAINNAKFNPWSSFYEHIEVLESQLLNVKLIMYLRKFIIYIRFQSNT